METKAFMRKWDGLLLAALLFVAGLILLCVRLQPKGHAVVIERNGERLQEIAFAEVTNERVVLFEGKVGIVEVTVWPDGAAITAADCSDQTCVKTGRVCQVGEAAICLPEQISIRITGSGRTSDAVTY